MVKKAGKTAASPLKPSAIKTAPEERSFPAAAVRPRRLKGRHYDSLRLQKRIRHPVKLPGVWRLTKTAAGTLWLHKRLFVGIALVYGGLNVVLAQGLAGGTDVSTLKATLNQAFTGNFGSLVSGLSIFAALVGSAGNTSNAAAGAYQILLALIGSLAVIWALRQVLSGTVPRVRDTYYRGMYPLIPFLLVLIVVGLQLIPLAIGSSLYSLVINNGIAVYFVEKLMSALLFGLLALLTLYLLSSSLFALYIVTLPDMTPMKALRSARELVRYRRWTVLRKILCLPVVLLIAAMIVMLPIILLLTTLAQYVFFVLTMFGLVAAHAYMYVLYRELLNE